MGLPMKQQSDAGGAYEHEQLFPVMDRNTSGLHPKGHAVLIQTYEPQLESKIIAIPDAVQRNQHMMNQRAVVIEVGPSAWDDEPTPRAQPGDHVLVTKYAGFVAGADMTKDGKVYRLVNDRDVFCTLES